MKAKAIQFLCILCAVSLLSCEKENEAPDGFVNASFSAAFDESSQEFYSEDGSKTYRSGSNTLWSASDQINVFYSNSTSSNFTLTSGNGTASAQFAGLAPAGKTANYAVYPAGATAARSSNTVVNVTVPENQTEGTFASCNYAVSCIHSGNELYFSNIAAMLCIQASDAARTIVVESVGGNALCGTLPVTCSSGTVSVGAATSTGSSITVSTSGSGKKYIAILGGVTHANGLKFTFKNSSNAIIGTYFLNKSITTAKDKMYNFGDFEPTKAYYVTVSGAGNGNGLSWTNAMSKDTMFGMLSRSAAGSDSAKEAALFDAINGATFYMAAGTYDFGSTPTIDIDEASAITFTLKGGYNSSTGARNISGNKTYITGARAGSSGSYTGHHCLDLSGTMNVTLDGLYLIDGYVHGSNAAEGALTFSGSGLHVTMTDCTVSNHLNDSDGSTDSGAAIFMSSAGGLTATRVTFTGNESHCAPALFSNSTSMTFNNCTFTSNHARSWGGAARLNGGNAGYSITFNSCTFSSNSASGDSGCFVQSNGTLTFNSCSFTGNTCTGNGGALTLLGSASPVTISGCTFSGNTANHGGALWSGNNNTKTVTIEKNGSTATTFTNNDADTEGGAIYSEAKGTISVSEAIFKGNHVTSASAGNGGAIALRSNAQTLNLTSCTFGSTTAGEPNYSAMDGGVLSLNVGSTTITSCSFVGNYAFNDDATRTTPDRGYGGAIDCYGSASLSISGTTTFTSNNAWRGGALNLSSTGTVSITNATFKDNGSSNTRGGGVAYVNRSATFTTCTMGVSGHPNQALYGGALHTVGGTATIKGCTIQYNTAADCGGGICNEASILVQRESSTNTTFSNNVATNTGGAVYIEGSGTSSITGAIFNSNHTSAAVDENGKHGGAIYITGSATMKVFQSAFNGNYGSKGGAIHSQKDDSDNKPTVFIDASSFSGNYIQFKYGTAINIDHASYFCINNSSFNNNTYCVGNYNTTTGRESCWLGIDGIDNKAVVSNCTLMGGAYYNTSSLATNGALVCIYAGADNKVVFVNSLFINNVGNIKSIGGESSGGVTVTAYYTHYSNIGRINLADGSTGNFSGKWKERTLNMAHTDEPSWQAGNYWDWSGDYYNGDKTAYDQSYSKISKTAFTGYLNDACSKFVEWLDTDIDKDCRRVSRGDSNWRPGAYQQ